MLQDGSGHVISSRWSIAGLDPIPISAALPAETVTYESKPTEWQASSFEIVKLVLASESGCICVSYSPLKIVPFLFDASLQYWESES